MGMIQWLVAIVGLAGVGIGTGIGAYALIAPPDAPAPPPQATTRVVSLGEQRLTIPTHLFRGPPPKPGDVVDRIVLKASLVGLAAPLILSDQPRTIAVTLVRPDDTIDPADRVADVYARFLTAEAWSHPSGLILRRFDANSPYLDEDLLIAPPDAPPFSARCRHPSTRPDLIPEACIWRLRARGLEIEVRFPPEHLNDWNAIGASVRALVARIVGA
jgi:hypothetical protein